MGINFIDAGLAESARQVVKTYIAGGTIVAGTLVKLDGTATKTDRAITVLAGTALGTVVGVALEAASDGERVRVAVKGYVADVLTDNSLTEGAAFGCSAAALATIYAGSEAFQPVGVALAADTGTDPYYCDVYLFGLFA